MTLTEAVNETALAVARALLDMGFTDAEVERAIEIMLRMNKQELRESRLLLCRERERSYTVGSSLETRCLTITHGASTKRSGAQGGHYQSVV